MSYPYTQLFGDVTVSVTATATGAVAGATSQKIGISLGQTVLSQIPDLAVRFGISRNLQVGTNFRPKFKVTYKGSDLNSALTFASQGVKVGDSIVLVDV